MKSFRFKFKLFLVLINILLLFGCKKEETVTIKELNNKIEYNIFYISDSVKLISFPHKLKSYRSFMNKGWLVPDNMIVDEVKLNENQLNSIYKILAFNNEDSCSKAACYEPRHMLRFYKEGKVYAYYEMCLECGREKTSDNLNFMHPFCIDKGIKLKELFKKMGLKNYGVGSPVLINSN